MSIIRELEWFETPVTSSEEEVSKIETQLGVNFPDDYRQFLMVNGGGSPVETDFVIDEPRGPFDASVGIFLHAGSGEYGIAPTLKNLESRRVSGLVPVAESGGGDFVCLDYREGLTPSISYWHHGRYGLNDEVVAVSRTFAEFLNLLQEPTDE